MTMHDPDHDEEVFVYRQGMRRENVPRRLTLVRVEEGTLRIEHNALDNNADDNNYGQLDNVRHIQLASSVTHIGNGSFAYLGGLVSLEIPPDSQLQEIGEGALLECLTLPNLFLPASLTTLGNSALKTCRKLRSIQIGGERPSELQCLGRFCFAKCVALLVMDLSHCPLLTDLPERAFDLCKSLQSIQLPPNLETIGMEAFRSCTLLKTITFPPTLTRIDDGAFRQCQTLNAIHFQSMRALPRVHHAALTGCKALCEIGLPQDHGNDDDTLTREEWPDVLPLIFWENGGLLERRSTEAQRLSCIFSFLQLRMDKLIEQ